MKLRMVDEVGIALDSITCDFFVYDQREGRLAWTAPLYGNMWDNVSAHLSVAAL